MKTKKSVMGVLPGVQMNKLFDDEIMLEIMRNDVECKFYRDKEDLTICIEFTKNNYINAVKISFEDLEDIFVFQSTINKRVLRVLNTVIDKGVTT